MDRGEHAADHWKDNAAVVLTSELYNSKDVGGWKNTLSNHADDAFEELDERGKRIAEKLFTYLSEAGPDGRGVRRPVSIAEVTAVAKEAVATDVMEDEVKQVIEKFQHSHRNFLVICRTWRKAISDQNDQPLTAGAKTYKL